MRRALVALLGIPLLALMAACAPITVESLESARVSGEAPTIESVAYDGAMGVQIEWTPDFGAQGWQTQYSLDDGATWVDTTSKNLIGEDAAMFGGSDIWWHDDAKDLGTALIRLRKIIDSSTVSPWATEGPIATVGSIGPECVTTFRRAAKQAADGGSESELARTLDDCASRSEWITTAQMFSGAIGLTEPSERDASSAFGVACRSYPTRQLCS